MINQEYTYARLQHGVKFIVFMDFFCTMLELKQSISFLPGNAYLHTVKYGQRPTQIEMRVLIK